MKKNILLILTPMILFAQTYMAKVEPYNELSIYAQSSGQIISLDKKNETKIVNKKLVQLDDSLEQRQLAIFEQQLKLYNKKLTILENSYSKYINIRGKSQSDKDDKLYEVIELKITVESLKSSIAQIKDSIDKKSVSVNNLYIKEFEVNNGDYVSIGTKLATAYDISKSKLIVYVSSDDYKDIKSKTIMIDGKSDIASIEKIDQTIDDVFVSAHKITLTIKDKEFGKIRKVEFLK